MADTSQAAAWPNQRALKRPLLPLGKVVATPGALALFEALNTSPLEYLVRHVLGDWGDLDAEDRQANDAALMHGSRILSSYRLQGENRIWLVTEADRTTTTFLLPKEY